MPDIMRSLPMLDQIYIRKLANFGSSYLGNDLYFLKEFVDLCIEDFGEENVKDMLINDNSRNKEKLRRMGENWSAVRRKINRLDKKLSLAKGFYDKIQKHDLSKINDSNTRDFLKYSEEISLIHKYLYPLFIFFLSHSSIKNKTIPSDAWRIIEHTGLKKLDATARRPEPLRPQNEDFRTSPY